MTKTETIKLLTNHPTLPLEGVDPVLTIAEIAAWLQLVEPTIWRWIAKGKFPKGFKLGRTTRWKMSVVQAWLDRQEAKAAQAHFEVSHTL